MRVVRHVVLIVFTALFLLVGSGPATAAGASKPVPGNGYGCPTQHRSAATTTAPPPLQRYYHGDWRLGPERLPDRGAIGSMLQGYQRLDDLSSRRFLACYWHDGGANAGWWFPDQNGFLLDQHGNPIERPVALRVGQKVDLFGSGFGHFLAPAGTAYEKRALPPSNLDTFDRKFPFAYHLYEATTVFTVQAGPIRPWFGQPGRGLQYLTPAAIPDLVTGHFLRPLR